MKTEFAYVIQRDDGKYVRYYYWDKEWVFEEHIYWSHFMSDKLSAKDNIRSGNLQNCKIVKVKIEIVGDEEC